MSGSSTAIFSPFRKCPATAAGLDDGLKGSLKGGGSSSVLQISRNIKKSEEEDLRF